MMGFPFRTLKLFWGPVICLKDLAFALGSLSQCCPRTKPGIRGVSGHLFLFLFIRPIMTLYIYYFSAWDGRRFGLAGVDYLGWLYGWDESRTQRREGKGREAKACEFLGPEAIFY